VFAMNKEVGIRRKMTPEVFDDVGLALVDKALAHSCGARFTGSGGGGCIWALGLAEDIRELRLSWTTILSRREGARLLDARIDPNGLEVS